MNTGYLRELLGALVIYQWHSTTVFCKISVLDLFGEANIALYYLRTAKFSR